MVKEEKDREAEVLPERWSAQAKLEVVLRLLRGEDLGEVSREIQVTAAELEAFEAEIEEIASALSEAWDRWRVELDSTPWSPALTAKVCDWRAAP